MFVGNRNRINLSSSNFIDFINDSSLYVDKTAFIEHVLEDPSKVLLFTRPRRMGKSLNMNTLATFLNCKQDTVHLFKGLYIENSSVFSEINKSPVIYLSFKDYNADNYKQEIRDEIVRLIEKYLKPEQLGRILTRYLNDDDDYSPTILKRLMEVLSDVYGKNPYILIDEYDKPIFDNMSHTNFAEMKAYLVTLLSSSMKDNPYLGKAILTGVTRIAKENLFSGLNNIVVYDIMKQSVYDADFSLTDEELLELVPADKIAGVREWYNNMRVGGNLLYNIYSVMNYLSDPEAGLKAYWARTGGETLLARLMNDQRTDMIIGMMEKDHHEHDVILDYQLNMEHLKNGADCSDTSFYTLSVQAGYLSHNHIGHNTYEIFIPNKEARHVWARLILNYQYNGADTKLADIFKGIRDTKTFSQQLTDFTSMVLSYNDFKTKEEWVYHVFFLGLVYSLGYECKSNLEAGLGRFDIFMKTRRFNAIIEFKASGSATDAALAKEADRALKQIEEKEYWHTAKKANLPLYKIGIACHGKKCLVKTVLHDKR